MARPLLDIGVWSKVPPVARFCEHPDGVGYRAACMHLPTPEFLWAVGIALFVWFLPDMIVLATDAFAFLYLTYHGRRHEFPEVRRRAANSR
ncbi:hypothetical protein PG993_007939 [Apiospora rasikravindrae]|uniref:Uncharacterized protein n=1 Tax=Apiospora rasikravindrae TaxID=990691 RepID=A0ABR1T181_9PEZI